MKITRVADFAINQNVSVVVNSANGWLFADSAGAGQIREASGEFSSLEQEEFDNLFGILPEHIKLFFEYKRKIRGWDYKPENLSCLKLLAYNSYEPHETGSAVFDPLWSTKSKKKIIHAITLGYDLDDAQNPKRVVGSKESIKQAYVAAMDMALDFEAKSIALPIPCCRPGYGITPKESLSVVETVLEFYKDKDIDVVLCHDNEHSAKLL